MSSRLPDFIDPWHFADIGKRITGTVTLADLPRLAPFLQQSEGKAEFELVFTRDERKRVCISGSVRANLVLQCQRCMGPLDVPVDTLVALVAVEGLGEAEQLPESVDPLLIEDSRVRLNDLVEDELMLSIPQVPMHAHGLCATDKIDTNSAPLDAIREDTAKPENPFAQLAGLKTKHTETE